MKTLLPSLGAAPAQTQRLSSLIAAFVTCAILVGFTTVLPAQVTFSDDFNDANDSGWEHYDPIGSHPAFPDQATWSFPGGAYRLRTAISPLPGTVGPGRAASLRPDIYTDFYVAADLVNWDDTRDQAIGLMARVSDTGLGTTDGYALTYQVPDHDIDITRIVNEGGPSVPLSPTSGGVTFVPGKSYRFVFIGKGTQLIGRIYELPNTDTPIIEVSGNDTLPDAPDSLHTSGKSGLIVFDNSGGLQVTDATFDNYYASDIEPPRLALVDYSFGDYAVSWPEGNQFILQGASTLAPNGWEDLTPTSTTAGTHFYDFTPGAIPGQRFFRLIRR